MCIRIILKLQNFNEIVIWVESDTLVLFHHLVVDGQANSFDILIFCQTKTNDCDLYNENF